MVYQKRGSATPNSIKLTFDFRTYDKLRMLADARKQPIDRCAYELLQERLDAEAPPITTPAPTPQVENRTDELARRFSSTNHPKGTA